MVEKQALEISCEEVWRALSDYIEGDVEPALHARMEAHFRQCQHCTAVLDGTENVIRLVGDERSFLLPAEFGRRLSRKLAAHLSSIHGPEPVGRVREEIPLGITEARVALGSHLVYFWETDAEFKQGVRFLDTGLRMQHHIVIFGFEEENQRVLGVLRGEGFDVDRSLKEGRLTLLVRDSPAPATLSKIGIVFQEAMRSGAPAIRFLGNLGVRPESWPGEGERDVLELEARVTDMAPRFPCVVVCMYDVRSLPGRMILRGGFETHPLTVHRHTLSENPHYVPLEPFLAHLRGIPSMGTTA